MMMNYDLLNLFDKIRKWIIEHFDDSNEVSIENYFAYKCNKHNFMNIAMYLHKISEQNITNGCKDP